MIIPLESRAHVIFTYTLETDNIGKIGIKKLYYEGVEVKVPLKWDLEEAAQILANSPDMAKTIDESGFKSFDVFTENKNNALAFRYDEVYENAKELESQVIASMYVESLNEEWTPF